jgi:hypothetical protein
MMAVGGIASAVPTSDDDADTLFNIGYDEEFHILFWGLSPNDDSVDCELENGPVAVEIGDEGAAGAEGFDDCDLMGSEVSGPNGQINHGMFMKLFNSLFEGNGRGCVNRYLAQTDFGKGDQKVKVQDVDPDFVPAVAGDTVDVDFETFLATCEHGKKDGSEDVENGANGHGRPDSPGKSGDAPGHNKDAG